MYVRKSRVFDTLWIFDVIMRFICNSSRSFPELQILEKMLREYPKTFSSTGNIM